MKVGSTSSFLNPHQVKYLNSVVFEGARTNHGMNKSITLDYSRQEMDKYSAKKHTKSRFKRGRRSKHGRHFMQARS